MVKSKTSSIFNLGGNLKLPPEIWLFCCLICFGCISLNAQQLDVTARLDSTYLLIGQQMQVALEVSQPSEAQVQFPTITDTLTRFIEILDISPRDTMIKEDGFAQIIQRLTITSFDSGYHIIPPIPFFVKNINGSTDTLRTNQLGLEVLLVPVDTAQAIMPIKGPADIPISLTDVLPGILSSLLLGTLVAGLILYFKKRTKRKGHRPQKPKEAPHVVAYRALQQLKKDQLWQSGQLKAYHSRLTDILREYIENRFQIPTLEKTSDEIFAAFEQKGLTEEVPFDNLSQLLRQADLVKFAKGNPLPEDNARSLEQAFDFVKKTLVAINTNEANDLNKIDLPRIKGVEGLSSKEINEELNKGGKFVVFHYCISYIVKTYRGNSGIYFFRSGESTFSKGFKYTLISLLLGWWGIPWGIIFTIKSIRTNTKGGENVTKEIIYAQFEEKNQVE
ncbi:MAG: hypothetical protein AAFZ15_16950 [Bacteroidota bacterium]